MVQLRNSICAALLALTLSSSASASTYYLIADLTPGAETVPPMFTAGSLPDQPSTESRPSSYGTALFMLNTDDSSNPYMTMTATVWNIDVNGLQTPYLNDNLGAAHIHATGPVNPLPANFPVRWGFFGAPDNDNLPDQLVVTPFANGVGGTFSSRWDAPEGNPSGAGGTPSSNPLASQIDNILAGRAYLNFHTVENPGGEVRGTLQLVPEPATTGLMAVGLGAIVLRAVRRRKQS